MGYQVFVECEREECNSRVQVPGVGQMPTGWLVLRWAKISLQNGQTVPEPVNSVFCSWKCILHFVKGYIEEKAESKRKVVA